MFLFHWNHGKKNGLYAQMITYIYVYLKIKITFVWSIFNMFVFITLCYHFSISRCYFMCFMNYWFKLCDIRKTRGLNILTVKNGCVPTNETYIPYRTYVSTHLCCKTTFISKECPDGGPWQHTQHLDYAVLSFWDYHSLPFR